MPARTLMNLGVAMGTFGDVCVALATCHAAKKDQEHLHKTACSELSALVGRYPLSGGPCGPYFLKPLYEEDAEVEV